MSINVIKFGGTSVADIKKLKNILNIILEELKHHKIIVVLSAMAGETNKLQEFLNEFETQNSIESDLVLTSGEQVTIGLLSAALKNKGVKSIPLLGWQVPIITDNNHEKAKILNKNKNRIQKYLENYDVIVLAGFQGISIEGNITSLGRGGSDTTAVAIASAVDAERCDIYTDVDGVYTSDPRIVKNAKKLNKISYEEMLEFASLGAKVLQTRSVEMAMRHGVTVQVLSSQTGKTGTFLTKEDEKMENELVSGIAYSKDEANVTLINILDKPGVATKIFTPLSEANINVDMIVQTGSENGNKINFTYTVSRKDLEQTISIMEKNKIDIEFERIITNNSLAKVSIVGLGMRTHTGVANKMFSALASKNINIHVISTSEIKISVLIDENSIEKALNSLHSTFELDQK